MILGILLLFCCYGLSNWVEIPITKEQSPLIDPDDLRDKILGEKSVDDQKKDVTRKYSEEVIDLHIDPLSVGINPNEMLEYQLNEFEKAYDNALVMNLKKLKIIHGVGAGILRKEIHKRISRKKEVKFFEDADKEKFGFGATVIYF